MRPQQLQSGKWNYKSCQQEAQQEISVTLGPVFYQLFCTISPSIWSAWKQVKDSQGVSDYEAQCGFVLYENIILVEGGSEKNCPTATHKAQMIEI